MTSNDSSIKRVAVPAISFSQVPELVERLLHIYPQSKINSECTPRHHTEQDTIDFLRGCDAAIVSFEPINERVLSALPELKVVSKLGVGLNEIDPVAMRNHGVRLGWTPGTNRRSVAELALCLAIAGLRHVVASNASMRAGHRPLQRLGRQLTGKTVGVHGCGAIGQDFIRLLQPFQCTLLASDIADRSTFCHQHQVEMVPADTLYRQSEILSIHLPLTQKTKGLYSAATLCKLRPDCVLINTARGGIVDEASLHERLKSGKLAAAGFDTFAREPVENDELLNLENFIATPHLGSGSLEARLAMGQAAITGLTNNFLPEPGVYPFIDS